MLGRGHDQGVELGPAWMRAFITRQAICHGCFASVKQLTAAIGAFIDGWNDRPRPFSWTKDADEILASIQRATNKTSPFTHH